jgi:hypothetical protein
VYDVIHPLISPEICGDPRLAQRWCGFFSLRARRKIEIRESRLRFGNIRLTRENRQDAAMRDSARTEVPQFQVLSLFRCRRPNELPCLANVVLPHSARAFGLATL